MKDEFRRARRKTGVMWVQVVEQWIKESGKAILIFLFDVFI